MSISVQASDGTGSPANFSDIDGSANSFVYTYSRLVFSGSYSTGGDTLDLTSLVNAGVPTGAIPIAGWIEGIGSTAGSQGITGGYYVFIAGTAFNNNKVLIFAAGGTQLGAGAYPASVTGDVIVAEIIWRKLRNY